jgi:membrane protease YdiL (CAAX protease family)
VWLYVASYGKGARSFADDFGWGSERFDALRGTGAGIATLIAVGLFSALVGDDVGDPTFGAVEPSGTFELVLLGATIVVGAPVIEELFFRGLFLRAVAQRTGSLGGVVITSAVFGLLHVPQRGSLGFAQAFVPLFVVGLVLGWLAVRYRRLGPSVAAHMTINAIGFLGLLAN